MEKEKINLRDELHDYKFQFGLLQKIPCSKEENKQYEKLLKEGGTLPDGVYAYRYESGEAINEFYTIYEPELTESEKQEYLIYKKLSLLKTIRNCTLFFTLLTILGIIVSLIFN